MSKTLHSSLGKTHRVVRKFKNREWDQRSCGWIGYQGAGESRDLRRVENDLSKKRLALVRIYWHRCLPCCGLASAHSQSLPQMSSALPLSHTLGMTSALGLHFCHILWYLSGSFDIFFLPLNLFHFPGQSHSLSYFSSWKLYSFLSPRSGHPRLFVLPFSPPDPSFTGGFSFHPFIPSHVCSHCWLIGC